MWRQRRQLGQLIEEYEIDLRAKGRSERTIQWYEQKLGHFARFLETRRLSMHNVTRRHLREFILILEQTKADENNPYKPTRDCPLSRHTVKGYVQVIKGFWHWLVTEGYLKADPFDRVALPKPDKKEMDIKSDEEMETLFTAARGSQNVARDTALLWTLYGTGVRLDEVAQLDPEEIRLGRGAYMKVRGKGAKERLVPLGAKVQDELARYLRGRASADGALFLSASGTPLTDAGVYQIIKRLAKRAGVKVSPHALRHTFATNYLMNGGDPESLRLILGHETLYMAMEYVHLKQKHLNIQTHRFSPADALWAKMRRGRRSPGARVEFAGAK